MLAISDFQSDSQEAKDIDSPTSISLKGGVMAAGKLFGLKMKEPNWNLSKEEDYLQVTLARVRIPQMRAT